MITKSGEYLFHWPLDEHIITVGAKYKDGTPHRATDFRCHVGTPVYAMESGVVDQTQTWDGKTVTGLQSYGNMVRIDHGDYLEKSLKTRYAHLSSVCVKQGEAVKAGQVIGYSGATGNCFGAHLHVEVWWGGKRSTNPLVWLDGNFQKADKDVIIWLTNGQHSVLTEELMAEYRPQIILKDIVIKQATKGDIQKFIDLASSLGLAYEVET